MSLTQAEIDQRLRERRPTNIDARTLTRTVPMEVLNLGLCRTGTASLRQALFQLGYFDVHRTSTIEESHADGQMWVDAFDAKYRGKGTFSMEQWDQLLGRCTAVTGYPASAFAPELIAAYPKAKVVLSVSDNVHQWHKTVCETTWAQHTKPFFMRPGRLGDVVVEWLPPFVRTGKQLSAYCYEDDFPRTGRKVYNDHIEELKRLVPSDKLLIYNVKQGWAPLCQFLDKPIPPQPFPREDDTKEFIDKIEQRTVAIKNIMQTATQVVLALLVIAMAAIAFNYPDQLMHAIQPRAGSSDLGKPDQSISRVLFESPHEIQPREGSSDLGKPDQSISRVSFELPSILFGTPACYLNGSF